MIEQRRDETVDAPALPRLAWEARASLRAALHAFPVVHLPAPDLSADEVLAFVRSLGTPERTLRSNFQLAGHPELMIIGNVRDVDGRKIGGQAIRQGFHSDMSWRRHAPALTVLYAREAPPTGGDTLFTSLYAMYAELDEATRAAWAHLHVRHENDSSYFDGHELNGAVHPLIRRHPETDRPLVFASPSYATRVLGLDAGASDALLERLRDRAACMDAAHRWQKNDMVIWDNRAALHCATPFDQKHTRCLWRASVAL